MTRIVHALIFGTLFLLTTPAMADFDRARRSTAQVELRVSSSTQLLGTGSAVLVSPEGYLLTAFHVVADAIDREESLDDQPIPRTGVSVDVKFVTPAPRSYRADIVRTAKSVDLALLKITIDHDDLVDRRVAILDPDHAHVECVDTCYRIFGFSNRGFASNGQPATPTQTLLNTFKRELASNMDRGFSGGPVFYVSQTPWTVVGIGISGLANKQTTNFMVSIHGAATLLDPLSERLSLKQRRTFPTTGFLNWLKIGSLVELEQQPKRLFDVRMELVDRMLVEDARESTQEARRSARNLLETGVNSLTRCRSLRIFARLLSRYSVIPECPDSSADLAKHTLGTQKLTWLDEFLEDAERPLSRWATNSRVHWGLCAQLADHQTGQSDFIKCWNRADLRSAQVWDWHLQPMLRWISLVPPVEPGEAQRHAKRAGKLVVGVADHLLTWGEQLSELATTGRVEDLELSRKRFRDPYLVPVSGSTPPLDEVNAISVYRDAALNKFLKAQQVLQYAGENPDVWRTFDGNVWLKRWCRDIVIEIDKLRLLQPRHKPYELFLANKRTNELIPPATPSSNRGLCTS